MRMMLLFTLLISSLAISTQAAVQNVTVDDTSPLIVYSPAGVWTVHSNVGSSFGLVNNGDSFTSALYAYISYSFYANAIYFFGNLGSAHGNYTVTLDGADPTIVSGYGTQVLPPVCLYSRTGLDLAVQHTIVINQTTAIGPKTMEIDAFIITTDPAITQPGTNGVVTASPAAPYSLGGGSVATGSAAGSPASASQSVAAASASAAGGSSSSSGGGSNIGAIAGGAAGGVIAILVASALFFYCRRRSRRAHIEDGPAVRSIGGGAATKEEPKFDAQHSPSSTSSYTTMPNAASTSPSAPASSFSGGRHLSGSSAAGAAVVGGAAATGFALHNPHTSSAPSSDAGGGGSSTFGYPSSAATSTAAASYPTASDEKPRLATAHEEGSASGSNFVTMGASGGSSSSHAVAGPSTQYTPTSAEAEKAQLSSRDQAVAPVSPGTGVAAGPSQPRQSGSRPLPMAPTSGTSTTTTTAPPSTGAHASESDAMVHSFEPTSEEPPPAYMD